jgi:Mn2+/Fe2+ NRAMP family transporter
LAGSSGYVLADTFGWKQGLNKKFEQAKAFYIVIAAATSIGSLINLVNIDPIRALIYAAVINAITSISILFALLRISNDNSFLKNETNGKLSNAIGWLTFIVMGISVIIMFIAWGK